MQSIKTTNQSIWNIIQKLFLITIIIIIIQPFPANAASIMDEFNTEMDEFSGSTTYYPRRFANYEMFINSGISLTKPVSVSSAVVKKEDESIYFYCIIAFVTDVKDHWILADKIYIKTDDERYTISYPREAISTSIAGKQCLEMYQLTDATINKEMQEDIQSTETLKIRVGESEVVDFKRTQLEDLQNAIELLWYLAK